MANINVFSSNGEKISSMKLNDAVFGQEYNEALIHQVVVAQQNNKRQGTKSALTRSEVRGGGRKPWRQKGTGNARQGSIRAVQWIKGGVAFAPKPRDFSQKINKTAKDQALRSALSEKVRLNEAMVVDKFDIKKPQTKLAAKVLKNLKLYHTKTLLVVSDSENELVYKAARNIYKLSIINDKLINVYDIVANKNVLFTEAAIKNIEEAYK